MSTKKCSKFCKDFDQLGHPVNFYHKGSQEYGTGIGGVFSLLTTIFFTLFISMQVFGWMFVPTYNETISQSYIPTNEEETYTIEYTDFVPYFLILEKGDKKIG